MRLIDADALERMGYVLTRTYQQDQETMVYETKKLSDIPSAQTERSGKWIYKKFDDETGISNSFFCSKCGKPQGQVYINYCAACGAKMEVEHE